MTISWLDRSHLAGLAGMAMLCGPAVTTAFAQGAMVTQSGTAVTEDCGGGDATVQGSGDSIILRNACRAARSY
jgi:hypothetical protein